MKREIERTLKTLSSNYQNFPEHKYEIIVVDNGSDQEIDHQDLSSRYANLRYYKLENASKSPAKAINFAIEKSFGSVLGIMVDGARMLSPNVLNYVEKAFKLDPNAVVTTLGFHLGYEIQQLASNKGYDQEAEDELLDSVDWMNNGYELFKISCFAGSSKGGWFMPLPESNCYFFKKKLLKEVGAADERFDLPGGGFVNLDMYKRIAEHEDSVNYRIIGEGSFHQYHGGSSTSSTASLSYQDLLNNYKEIKGEDFERPDIQFQLLGAMSNTLTFNIRTSVNSWANLAIKKILQQQDNQGVIILGMHRSGTSMLAGTLEEAGLYLGDVINSSPFNKKGNKENKLLWKINDAVLEYSNGAWDIPPKNVRWPETEKQVRDQFLLKFVGKKLWGFKDPRTVLTLLGWLEVIPDPKLIGIFRHPILVAKSLKRRNKFSFDQSLQLWLEYNWRIKWFIQNRDLKIIEFSADPEVLKKDIRKLIDYIGLDSSVLGFEFLDKSLQTVDLDYDDEVNKTLLSQSINLYKELKTLSL